MSRDGPTQDVTVGLNGVAIARRDGDAKRYRTYEIHQRRRVGESTGKLRPRALIAREFLHDPYPTLTTVREYYPCYLDWLGNAYWITRYDDVTSVFVDDANFTSRSKRFFYGLDDIGRDLRGELAVARHHERTFDAHAQHIAAELVTYFAPRGSADLATHFAARLPLELLALEWGIEPADRGQFVERYWRMQRGVHGYAAVEQAGRAAFFELIDFFRPLLDARRACPGDDLVSVIAGLEPAGCPTTAEDLVATLLEGDHETLHGALANLWFLLLTHPAQLEHVRTARAEARLLKLAYLEALRHCAPVLLARRFARHEVERFGLLIPEGALVVCAAAAANRDPRVFANPDDFIVGRRDLTQREPRGMYRADGLASGIAFGLGPPSIYPAVPEDRPRSRYAITRDAALAASRVLIENLPDLALAPDAMAHLECTAWGGMHTCRRLHVVF